MRPWVLPREKRSVDTESKRALTNLELPPNHTATFCMKAAIEPGAMTHVQTGAQTQTSTVNAQMSWCICASGINILEELNQEENIVFNIANLQMLLTLLTLHSQRNLKTNLDECFEICGRMPIDRKQDVSADRRSCHPEKSNVRNIVRGLQPAVPT